VGVQYNRLQPAYKHLYDLKDITKMQKMEAQHMIKTMDAYRHALDLLNARKKAEL
jgi:hypothetical protein